MKKGYRMEVDGIKINPKTPKYMNYLDIEKRTEKHLNKWWNVPYIETYTFSSEAYKKHFKRLTKLKSFPNEKIRDIETYEKEVFEQHVSWLKAWKHGVRYDVRILDGGAWDRTTSKGMFDNLEDAIKMCKSLL